MKSLSDNYSCCGCGACASVCPKGAIVLQPDVDGFVYPQVVEDKCVNCDLCEKVCAYRNQTPSLSLKEVYAAVSGNTDVRESASGGLFASFAQAMIADGGAVYGCTMEYENGKLWPRHICVTEKEDLIRLKGSKYVQSDLGDSYQDIQRQLKDGKTVLFSGTPCQVAGLKGFLQKDYENLFTVDIVCHGVPSVKLFQDYIAYEEKKRGAKITSFNFRDKSQGWKLYGSMTLDNGQTIHFEPEESSYYQMFLNSYTYRKNCYTCPYASDHRAGDITVGDFWCIELVHPELLMENGGSLDHKYGISCLIVNNEKGRTLLSRYGNGIQRWASTYDNASKYNHQLTNPSVMKSERSEVLALSRNQYERVESWYRRRLQLIKIRRNIRKAIPRPLKDLAKKYYKSKGANI